MSKPPFLPLNLYVKPKHRKTVQDAVLAIEEALNLKLRRQEQRKFFTNLCYALWYLETDSLLVSFDGNYYSNNLYNLNKLGYSPLKILLKQLGNNIHKTVGRYQEERSKVTIQGNFKHLINENRTLKDSIEREPYLIKVTPPRKFRFDSDDKELLPYPNNNTVKHTKSVLKLVNEHFKTANILFDSRLMPEPILNILSDGQLRRVKNANTSQRHLVRRFISDTTKHGRFYGGFWQSLPSAARNYIFIDEMSVARLDFKAQHCNMLYLKATGKLYPFYKGDPSNNKDPFAAVLDSNGNVIARALAKLAFHTMINCSTPRGAAESIKGNEDIREASEDTSGNHKYKEFTYLLGNYAECKKLVNSVYDYHEQLQTLLFRKDRREPLAYSQMLIDSNITLGILERALDNNITVLPVHDEYICESSRRSKLTEIMYEAYCEEMQKETAFDLPFLDFGRYAISYDYAKAPALPFCVLDGVDHRIKP